MHTLTVSEIPVWKNRCNKCHHFMAYHKKGSCTMETCTCTVNYNRKFDPETIISDFLAILEKTREPLGTYDLTALHGDTTPAHVLTKWRIAVLKGDFSDKIQVVKTRPLIVKWRDSKDYLIKDWWTRLENMETISTPP